ncbi:MAG: hypothetical protein ACKVOP_02735 [Sphingomonadaceae bacterium]
MTRTMKLLVGTSCIAFSAFGVTTAHAAGTTSGSTITNVATVNYSVGGVAQTPVNGTNNFTVDRRITLTVSEPGNATTTVAPGQTAAVTTFTVTNTSNAPLDFGLSLVQPAGGTAAHGGTDTFDVTAASFFVDTNGNGTYDAGTDQAVTFLDEVAADASRTVFVVANIPAGETNGEVAGVTLTAQAREAGGAGVQGAVVAQTAGANTAGVDTVFADTAGATDAARDGQFSARDDYTVGAAALTITKTATIISDPLNGTTNPKMIPGATVEYCIQVANAAGGATATNVVVTDPVPAQTTYDAGFGIFFNTTVTAGVCNADGTNPGGTFAANTVTGTAMTVPASTTRAVRFRVTLN